MPTTKDLFGNVLEEILVAPLYGDVYKFTDPKEAIKFIRENPDATMGRPMTFSFFKITILYQGGNNIKMEFDEKNEPARILSVLFELEIEE